MLNPNSIRRSNRIFVSGRGMVAGVPLIALAVMLVLVSSCSIAVKDKDDKKGETQVDIKSPVGDLHVSEQVDIRDSGLSVYPGAKPAPKEDSNDKSANVNISVPGFQLKVVAAEFLSDDAPDKVIAYYNKELGRFGKPIQCHGWNAGQAHASGGDDVMSRPVACSSDDAGGESIELKVGTEGNQHLVSVKPNNKGSRFALVYVRMHTGKDTTI